MEIIFFFDIYYTAILKLRKKVLKWHQPPVQPASLSEKNRPVGPISLDGKGHPYGPHYDALVERINQHVCYAVEFSPALTWPDHKNSGRVHRLYLDMAVSYFNI